VRLYLTWSSVPELASLPKDRRRQAWRYALPKALFHPTSLLVLVAASLVMSVIGDFVRGTSGSRLWDLVIALPFLATVGVLYGSFLTHRARPHLARFLAQPPDPRTPAA
jgi:hypothetical protein